jgi:hypothetical protein
VDKEIRYYFSKPEREKDGNKSKKKVQRRIQKRCSSDAGRKRDISK